MRINQSFGRARIKLYGFDDDSRIPIEPLIVGHKNVAVGNDGGSQMKRVGSLEVVLRAKFGGKVNNVARERENFRDCIGEVIIEVLRIAVANGWLCSIR
jgi:hypothetical protein